ncbi:MAG: helix-turn-helix transcriptional regulator [Oscillospiraceae bacterium]|nr:helix-turn-helix transcriptional regulator [Oscillospiraceae bacterium]
MFYKIRVARERLKISQQELSERSGISRATISGLESGSITVTTTETLLKIASALNMKIGDIFLD